MDLGAFSLSLNVADLAASRRFYEALGFQPVGGVAEQGWLILRQGSTTLGLFSGMIEANTLTFNPGWTSEGTDVPGPFDDVRAIRARLIAAGLTPETDCDPDGTGPAHLILRDPDGNPVLIDQHR
ncbi:VOC family protein [Jannaschia sp. KMU-145]|uniref:VOC family protein n=1 Tax=Jannaschia halovivens TaxID=3388667 RepID=UPI00396B2F02